MESALGSVNFPPYRRLVQIFWDPEPTNDQAADQPVWCLGNSYILGPQGSDNPTAEDEKGHRRTSPTTSDAPAHKQDSGSVPAPATENETATSDNGPDGRALHSTSSSLSSSLAYNDDSVENRGWPSAFLNDFESKFWMTYRSEFQPIPKSEDPRATSALSFSMRVKSQLTEQSGFTSDSGWGCMIRSGQSLLANAMARFRLGKSWRRGVATVEETKLMRMFADDPRAPYSIHQFVKHGARACGKYPGEWFGPSATAQCIHALANSHESDIRVYSTGNGTDVYQDRFMEIAKSDGQTFHPTLILVGTRLGIDKITPVYWDALIASLQMPQSVGIAGGRPSSSHYFIGAQGSHLFYLDPHHTRPALPYYEDPGRYSREDVDSIHTRRLRRLHVREMDPSMLIGFLIEDEEDWQEWKRDIKHVQGKAVIRVAEHDPLRGSSGRERESAIDEVEAISDDEDGLVDSNFNGRETGHNE